MRCTKWWSWIARGLVLASCFELGCAEEPPETSVAAVHAFARAAPAPSITSFTPSQGVQGTLVTIQGNNFEVGSTVAFNGTLATAVTRSSARQLLATVPPLATSGPIRVSHTGGNASSAQPFGVLPAITSVTPLEVFPGDQLSVLGTGFTGTTAVRLGSVVARFQRVSDTRLDVTVPGGATTAQLQVEKPSGVATSAQTVTVLPVLSGMSPTRGEVGSVVRLTGAGFTRVTTVRLGRLTAAFVLVDDRNLDATVPPAAVSARWEVIAPTSSARSATAFEVVQVQAPVVTSFSPARSALPARVVLTGTGFTGATSVTLAGQPLPFTVGSATTLTVEVPLGATSGRFAVTTPAGTGTSARDFVVIDRCAGVVCSAADACHVAGTCDPLTGACSAPIAADGTPCDDGLLCTVGDACLFGACGGQPVVCAARDECHLAGVCNPTTGACSDPSAADGTACDDHDACTLGDACVAGACEGDSRQECAAADQCRAAGACDPLSGACTGAPLPEGTACDDGEPSTTQDACTAGVCSGAVPAAGDVLQAEVEAGATVKTDSGDGATPRDAVETAVESPLDGLVSIAEVETVTAPPPGFVLLEQEVQIEAPVASPGMPLVLTFTLDSSLLPPGVTVGTLQVFRNGVLVPACAGVPGQADPDPCVSERATIGDDAVITALTSRASVWSFGYLDLVRGKIATGKSHTCAIREEGPSGGRVYCWGSDVEGQLGNDAALQSSPSPVLVATMGDAIRVSAGHNHTCVLRDDGTVWCWGRGDEGQLGRSVPSGSAPLPVQAGSFSDAVDVAAGSNHTCVVLASGAVECWGVNNNGQLGDLAGANTATPQAVPNVSGALKVTGGGEHTCALYERLVNGSMRTAAKCWGKGNLLGDGTSATTPRRAVDVSGLDDVTALSAGTLHTCALRFDGTVACWGSGSQGQLGCGGNSTCLFPMSVLEVANAVQIAAGSQHTCALKADGEVSCWGDGSSGERGDGSPVSPALTPVQTLDLIGVKHLSAGFARTCALRSDGTVRCWGATTNDGTAANALGTGTTEIASTPVATSGVSAAAELTSGLTHSCVRVGSGIRCWGSRARGQLGDGHVAPPVAATPVTVIDLAGLPFADAAQLAAGSQHSCVLSTAGAVACFGSRANGQLGDGLLPDATATPPIPEVALAPTAVTSLTGGGMPDPTTGLPDVATQIAAGNLHTCAVLSATGKVVCWGAGSEGQLGHGSTTARAPTPVTVGLSTRATQVAAGGSHSCARLEDGRVACWGQARNGQLGHGATTPIRIPSPVLSALDALDRATQVTTGGTHTCALLETRTVKCWGLNGNGQLGTGTTALAASPVPVVGLADVVQVAAGEQHTCALVEGGTVKCWGYGLFGQLGNGGTLNSLLPVDVVGLADAVQLAAGSQHTCARRAGGSVACWGSGLLGQRGDNYPYAATPLPVPRMAPFGTCLDANLCDGTESHDLYGACIEGTPLSVGDDGNACTSDLCDPALGVRHVAVADGSACNDGNACTQTDACVAGACTGASPVVCAPPDACHGAGVCNSGTGTCEYAALPDGTTCATAADACTTAPTCIFGVCTDGDPITCNDDDACTTDGCNPFTGCTTTTLACDDANACTADSCDPFTGCGHTAVTCDDGIACTVDSCDPASGCSIASSTCGPIPGLGPIEFEIARPLAAENGWQFGPPKLADMNQDGNADLAYLEVVDADRAMMAAVRLGQGDGTFLTPMLVPLAAEIGPGPGIDMEILDANADGALDIVATYNGEAGAALVALAGDGTGTLSVQRTIPLGQHNPRLAVLDLDQNGLLDAVVGISFVQGAISELRVYYDVAGTAEPSVSVESLPPRYWIRDLEIGDMDADGLSDLLVLGYDFSAPQSASSILVGLNDASGGLEPSVPLIGLGRYGFALALRASNADAYPDIVVATADGILAFASSGPLSYGPPTVLGPVTDTSPAINGTEQRLITSDLDSDGNQDVAYAAGPSEPLRLLFADNQGGTVVDVSLDTGYTVGVAAADLDHDGLVDLVTAGDAPRLVMGKAPRDFAAPTIFATLGAAPVGPLDLNGDAHPDFVLVEGDGTLDASIVEAVGSPDGHFTLGAPTSLGGYFLWNHAILRGAQPASQGVALVSRDLDGAGPQVVVFEVSSPDGIVGSQVLELPEFDPSGSITVLGGSFAGDPSDELLVAYSAPTDPRTRLVSFSWEDGALGLPVTLAEHDGAAALMASLDANGDQRRDFVLWREDGASTTGYVLEVYLGQTDGTFTVAATVDMSVSDADSVAAGDLTGDGLDELVVARSSCGSPENECVTVLENMADGSFEPLAGFSDDFSSGAFSPVIADFNNDLRNDLAFAGYGLTIVPGTDSGLGVERVSRGISVYEYRVSDVTADGKLDLVAVSQFGLEVVVNVSGTEVISSPFCGDRTVQGSEICDDGNARTETDCPVGVASCTVCAGDCSEELVLANECAGGCGAAPCDFNSTCSDPSSACGDRVCTCNAGFSDANPGNDALCVDVDECAAGTDTCDPLSAGCDNLPGSFTCGPCPLGYTGDGHHCSDVNECVTGTHDCDDDPPRPCMNMMGSYTCGSCPAGYDEDGPHNCIDIDECAADTHNCDPLMFCTNTRGSFTCGP